MRAGGSAALIPQPRFAQLLWLGALAVMTAGALVVRSEIAVDDENRAMRSVGTADHRLMVRRAASFGDDPVILALVETTSDTSDPIALADALADAWSTLPSVARVADVPLLLEDAAALSLALEPRVDGSHRRTLDALRARAAPLLPPGATLTLTGQPAAEIAVATSVAEEQRRILPWAIAILIAVLFAAYRHAGLVLAAIVPSGMAILWTGAIYQLYGHRLDPIAALIEPVVLTVGVAGAVHVVEAYRLERGRGLAPHAAGQAAIRDLGFPAALTVGTTVAGFLALALHPVPAIERFGVYAALGSGLTCVLTFLATPLLLALTAPGARRDVRDDDAPGASVPWERRYARLLARTAPLVLVATLALALWSSWSWTRLRVDTDPVAVLPSEHPFRQDFERVAARIGAIETFDVLIPAGAAADADGALLAIEDRLLDEPLVVDLAEDVRRAPNGDLLITAALERSGSTVREELFARLDAAFALAGIPQARCVGTAVRIARDSGLMVRGQLRSIGLTLFALVVAGLLGFRSLRLALFGIVPNVLPCLTLYGTMAAMGEPLSVASAMIGSVMLGLIVDDTIHVLYRYRLARAADRDRESSIAAALHHAGRPVVLTSIALAGGFLAGLSGTLTSTREFAVLSAGVIVAALIADLLIAPSLLLLGSNAPAPARPLAENAVTRRLTWLPLVPMAIALVALFVHESRGDRETEIARAAAAATPFEETLAPWPDR